jgi:hypothetical protein
MGRVQIGCEKNSSGRFCPLIILVDSEGVESVVFRSNITFEDVDRAREFSLRVYDAITQSPNKGFQYDRTGNAR